MASQRGVSESARNTFTAELKDHFSTRLVFRCPPAAARRLFSDRAVDTGRENTGIDALDWLEHGVKNGAGELVVNSIDTDGVKNGFDLELLDAVAQRCAVPIIASGGAGKMDDFKELFLNHPRVDAGLAASIFHTKQVDIRDLKLYLRENGVEMRV